MLFLTSRYERLDECESLEVVMSSLCCRSIIAVIIVSIRVTIGVTAMILISILVTIIVTIKITIIRELKVEITDW